MKQIFAPWQWLTDNGTALGVVLALIPIVWAVVQFILIKKADERRLSFTTFHNLIKQLVEPENPNQPLFLDRQIAIIFELRNFKNYYPVTLRILKGLKSTWAVPVQDANRQRLMEELELTIKHIERKL
jgi:hypothetical protein